MTEREFQNQVIQLARLHRWQLAHFRPARTARGWRTAMIGDKGFPDLTLVRERLLFAELKTDQGKLSPEQERWIWLLRNAGQDVFVWRPADWDSIVEELTRGES